MINMKHSEWFHRTTNGASGNAAAAKAGISVASLNRHIASEHLTAEEVIAISRAYGESPVNGLAATGHITYEEASGMTAAASAELLSDLDLIRTLAYRINADPAAWFGTFGELADQEDELATRRSNTTAEDVRPEFYAVADSSPDEDAMRAEEEGDVD